MRTAILVALLFVAGCRAEPEPPHHRVTDTPTVKIVETFDADNEQTACEWREGGVKVREQIRDPADPQIILDRRFHAGLVESESPVDRFGE